MFAGKNRIVSSAVALCLFLSLCGCSNKATEESLMSQVNSLQEENARLSSEKAGLESEIAVINAELAEYKDADGGTESAGNSDGEDYDDFIKRIEDMGAVGEGAAYKVFDSGFYGLIKEAGWDGPDGTMDAPGVYNINAEAMEFVIKVDDGAPEKVYCALYFSTDNDFDEGDIAFPYYEDTIELTEDGTVFDFLYEEQI